MDLLTFGLGILASGIAALIYNRMTRPRLRIAIDEAGRVRGEAQGLHEFHHLVVVVRQFAVPDMKRISFCLAQALRFGIAG